MDCGRDAGPARLGTASENREMLTVDGGILVQDVDKKTHEKLETVTEVQADEDQISDMIFGEIICRYVKSNAIVIVKDKQVLGVGAGQVNRIWAAEQALERAAAKLPNNRTDGAVLISDAFFPFSDVVNIAVERGIKAIIQPGGSLKDGDSIKACNDAGIAMVFTATRHFKH